MSDYFGKDVPKLGFGLMRLPRKGVVTDIEQVKKMVDMFCMMEHKLALI